MTRSIRIAIDSGFAHASRVYDYLVGGTNNFPSDREAAQFMADHLPGGLEGIKASARRNRLFLGQAVRYLAREQGIHQFLDIGSGIPTVNQTHEVAQEEVPEARIVYVDSDPIVLAHAHTLVRGTPEGHVVFVQNDLRQPDKILALAEETFDPAEPVALMLLAILHMVPDEDHPYEIVRTLVDALPSGSYLVLSHLTADFSGPGLREAVRQFNQQVREQFISRSQEDLTRFFAGLDLVPPGIASVDDWLAEGPLPPGPDARPRRGTIDPASGWVNPMYAAIGRKP